MSRSAKIIFRLPHSTRSAIVSISSRLGWTGRDRWECHSPRQPMRRKAQPAFSEQAACAR